MARGQYRWSDRELRRCEWVGRLPVPQGDVLPRTCPICKSPADPTFDLSGRMMPCWPFVCNAEYEPQDRRRLRDWAPEEGCPLLTCCQALAWVRELCRRKESLVSVAEALSDPMFVAPYAAGSSLPVAVDLPPWRGDARPSVCPACRGRRAPSWGDYRFSCGSAYRWCREARQIVTGSRCPRPTIDYVLRLARSKAPPWMEVVCNRALYAYGQSVRVIQVFGTF